MATAAELELAIRCLAPLVVGRTVRGVAVVAGSLDVCLFFTERPHPELHALRIATVENAYLTFEEELKGRIEPGMLADLTVLEDDFLTAPAERLEGMTVFMTVVGGQVVHGDAGN